MHACVVLWCFIIQADLCCLIYWKQLFLGAPPPLRPLLSYNSLPTCPQPPTCLPWLFSSAFWNFWLLLLTLPKIPGLLFTLISGFPIIFFSPVAVCSVWRSYILFFCLLVLRNEPRASLMLGISSTTKLHPQLFCSLPVRTRACACVCVCCTVHSCTCRYVNATSTCGGQRTTCGLLDPVRINSSQGADRLTHWATLPPSLICPSVLSLCLLLSGNEHTHGSISEDLSCLERISSLS